MYLLSDLNLDLKIKENFALFYWLINLFISLLDYYFITVANTVTVWKYVVFTLTATICKIGLYKYGLYKMF